VLAGWGEYGAFLLKSAEGAAGMLLVSSDNSTGSPSLKLVSRNVSGGADTTTIRSRESTFAMSGVPGFEPVVADGNAEGYIISVSIPRFDDRPAPMNGAKLSFRVGESLIAGTDMAVRLLQLSKPFSSMADVDTSYVSAVDFSIKPGITDYTVDISTFIDSWHNLGKANHGILVRPSTLGLTPNYAVLVPGDSVSVFFTKLPEAP
jgi:hypothetical protein